MGPWLAVTLWGFIRPYWVVLLLLLLLLSLSFFDTFRMGGDHESYPSLSFVEYNFSQEGFFTPLVYFLAGHYLDPWDAGEGGPKNGVIFCFFLFGALVSKFACFVLLKNLKTYGFDFGFLSFVVWISVGESLWTSWASRDILERPLLSKIVKNSCFF